MQDISSAPDFSTYLRDQGCAPLVRGVVTTLQVNVGKLCNQACHHCHVEAGPNRTEIMDERTVDRLLPDPGPEERTDVDAGEDADALHELARVGTREAQEALQEAGVPALVGDDVRIDPVVAHRSSKASSAC